MKNGQSRVLEAKIMVTFEEEDVEGDGEHPRQGLLGSGNAVLHDLDGVSMDGFTLRKFFKPHA